MGLTSLLPPRRRIVVLVILILVLASLAVSFLQFRGPSESYTGPEPISGQGLIKTSRLHYLIPSTYINEAVCAGVVSALVNGYPIPTIIGYKGENELNAADHLAKIRLLKRFLGGLAAENDDDMVIVVDSVDVLAQLPAEVMMERYFELRAQSEQRLADQRGISVERLHERGIYQTVLYGAGKVCFLAPDEPLCPLMPASNSARYTFGVKTEKDGEQFLDPRYLNSGTIMGPVGDLRRFMHAVLDLIDADHTVIAEWDLHGKILHHMDQWFTATLYVRQEYYRAIDMNHGEYPGNLSSLRELPKPRQGEDDATEFHVFVDFDSSFTQTQCRNELEIHPLQFSNHDLTASVTEDFFWEGSAFRPHRIQMPSNVYQALGRVWERLNRTASSVGPDERKWIQELDLGTNIASERIFAFYHNTCDKTHFLERYRTSWFYPYVIPLLREAREKLQGGQSLHPTLVDGRRWIAANDFPLVDHSDVGGVLTDVDSEAFLDLRSICQLEGGGQ